MSNLDIVFQLGELGDVSRLLHLASCGNLASESLAVKAAQGPAYRHKLQGRGVRVSAARACPINR